MERSRWEERTNMDSSMESDDPIWRLHRDCEPGRNGNLLASVVKHATPST